MTVKEKLEKFMRTRRRAEDTATLAAYFMVHPSTINHCMSELENEHKVIRAKGARGKNIWRWLDSKRVVVAHKPVAKQQTQSVKDIVGTPFKAQTSYPHIRGYDD
jgi:hypothetical protein